ncbi:DNA mismatch repair endonuclease MutL [Candidatus Nesciobacter abundans]|uniref:DNA mismatch repair protein MutL n=1 Tax=Candidatus Nesciobacter abundans TaxID=2601668 RepID=A0A5C0UG26_9PROT|nr:DNA mismatch repair endonuclease MutL [Candidatus Nesciobacter abundans]QEK39008.1 DNA mismatch repair endonuclease MutL [Candidatus Nesciobacter abundans]
MNIKLLSDTIVRQIAAGEVVIRPISIVKELVENSIDSGASQISIFIEDGGKSSITVEDNGSGISKEDLLLCIQNHASSKTESLSQIKTLGFRGEALYSISSVTNFTIHSSKNSESHGLEVFNTVPTDPFPIKDRVGTKVTVKDIFFNFPARLKFLRSESREWSIILEYLQKMCIAYPDIDWIWSNGKSSKKNYKNVEYSERLTDVFGSNFTNSADLDYEQSNYKISGKIFFNKIQNSTNNLMIFVNGRGIRDRGLITCIRNSFENQFECKGYPSGFIRIALPFNEVDVNIHPSKEEVRFLRWNFLRNAIESTFYKSKYGFKSNNEQNNQDQYSYKDTSLDYKDESNNHNQFAKNKLSYEENSRESESKSYTDIRKNLNLGSNKNQSKEPLLDKEYNSALNLNEPESNTSLNEPTHSMYNKRHSEHGLNFSNKHKDTNNENLSRIHNQKPTTLEYKPQQTEEKKRNNISIVARLQSIDCTIVCKNASNEENSTSLFQKNEQKGKFFIINHKFYFGRFIYRKLNHILTLDKNSDINKKNTEISKNLLIPFRTDISDKSISNLNKLKETLENIGLQFENNILISVPIFLPIDYEKQIFIEFADSLENFNIESKNKEYWSNILADIASQKLLKNLEISEIENILSESDLLTSKEYCKELSKESVRIFFSR